MTRPPRFWEVVLKVCAPAEECDHLLGDLAEMFEHMEEREGRGRARRWYRREVVRSAWALMTYPGRWRGMTMTGVMQDVRGALRVFQRAPGFAAVVVLTLAVGVGGASAVYSVVRGVLLTPLPFEDPDEVVMLWGRSAEYPRAPLTVGDHNALAEGVESFVDVTAAWSNTALLLGDADAEQVSVGWVTPEYFTVLGVRAAIGRTPEHVDEQGVLISHDLWTRRYGADPSVVGRVIDLSGEAFTVSGILPVDRDPNLTTFGGARADHDMWRLQPPEWTEGDDRSVGWLRSTARLQDGVTVAQAQLEVDALMDRINATITDRDGGTDMRIDLIPVKADMVRGVSRSLWILLAAVCTVLLIAASNVAHLVLARGEQRSGEVAVRAALGGSRARLMRQMVIESGVLAAAGGALGLVFATLGVAALSSMAPPSLPRLEQVRLDAGVFLFALLATGASAVVFALVPAIRGSRADIASVLGERSVTRNAHRQRLSRMLVVAEVAMSVGLVASTGLLLRSFAGLAAEDLGFERQGVVTFALEIPEWGDSNEAAAATMTAYLDRIRATPGVEAAGFTNRIPLAGGLFTGSVRSEEMAGADTEPFEASIRWVTPGYLDAMGARLVAGRTFDLADGVDRILIDQTVAERLWPDGNAVGRRVETSGLGADPAVAEVIGVVAPMKHHGVAEDATETIFQPMYAAANQQNFRYVAARVSGDTAPYEAPLRSAVREVDANAVVARVRSMEDLFHEDVAATRFASFLLTVFGAVALLLASIGLHGVMAYSVRRRTREIGIRVVLGAPRSDILGDAVRSGATLVGSGVLLGTLLALGAGELVRSLLYGIEPRDPATLLLAIGTVLVVGMLGAYLPARLVLDVDPAVTLREE